MQLTMQLATSIVEFAITRAFQQIRRIDRKLNNFPSPRSGRIVHLRARIRDFALRFLARERETSNVSALPYVRRNRI